MLRKLVSGDELARLIVTLAAAAILVITALLVLELWTNSHLVREKFGWSFLIGRVWDPNAGEPAHQVFVIGNC